MVKPYSTLCASLQTLLTAFSHPTRSYPSDYGLLAQNPHKIQVLRVKQLHHTFHGPNRSPSRRTTRRRSQEPLLELVRAGEASILATFGALPKPEGPNEP